MRAIYRRQEAASERETLSATASECPTSDGGPKDPEKIKIPLSISQS